MNRFSKRRAMVVYGGVLLVATATAALAGNGVGGIFNLGQVNTVNGSTELRGTTATQQLLVRNNSTAGNSSAVIGQSAGNGAGVWGRSNRLGVRASASAATGVTYGVHGTSNSPDGYAGFFQNTSTTTNPQLGRGIRSLAAGASESLFLTGNGAAGGEFAGPNGTIGVASHPDGAGVVGVAGTGKFGVFGSSNTQAGVGAFFINTNGNSLTEGAALHAVSEGNINLLLNASYAAGAGEFVGANGVVGYSARANGYALLGIQGSGSHALVAAGNARVDGNLEILGTLSKSAGTFKIDHPLDPANRTLSHAFVESPDMMNIYNGNAVSDGEGVAVVELPSYFEALNKDPRYQLTVIGSPATAYVLTKVSDNAFSIQTSEPNVEVSWQVTGIRQDAYAQAHPIVVEEEKAVADRGFYLTPEEHGQPASMAIGRQVAAQDVPASPDVQ